MTLSIFLARFLGLYLLVIAALWLFRRHQLQAVIREIFASTGLLAFSGLLALMFGIALVVSHSIWELSWRGLITLFGYLGIVKGVVRLGFPDWSRTVIPKVIEGYGYWMLFAFLVALGVFFTYCGFTN